MRWFPFSILAYLMIALHVSLRHAMSWNGSKIDFALLAVIFIALNAPREYALIGCFVLGALVDIFTIDPLGLNAFSYGLVGLVISATQQMVYRENPVTHAVMAMLGGLISMVVTIVHAWIHTRLHPAPASSIAATFPSYSPSAMNLFLSAVYTAILAPVIIGLLQRTKRLFHFRSSRQAMGIQSRMQYS